MKDLYVGQLNGLQKDFLREIATQYGFFYRDQGSQELLFEEEIYRVYVDFDTGSVATISPTFGKKIAENRFFRNVNEIYFRGQKIWPLQTPAF